MKRQIKFRGKEITSGEWIYGYYTQGSFIDPTTGKETVRHLIHADHIYDVEENTVGQFTGLQDSKGNDIYEGDIIDIGGGEYSVVSYCDSHALFDLSPNGLLSQEAIIYGCFEVVGNVFDNSDLLH